MLEVRFPRRQWIYAQILIHILGLGILFGKLQQGVAENQQILTIARMRAEAEDVYGMRLGEIGPATDRITGGFSRDDGASVRKVGIPIIRR
jgi:hypothetical protein